MSHSKKRDNLTPNNTDIYYNVEQHNALGSLSIVRESKDNLELTLVLSEFDLDVEEDLSDTDITHLLKYEIEEQFKVIFRDNFASLCLFAEQFVEDEELAKDVVHDSFLKLWERPELFLKAKSIRLYLYSVVRNRCLDTIRKGKLGKKYASTIDIEHLMTDEYFEVEVVREEVYRLLYSAIEKLPERSREVLKLKMQGLKNHEIAESLGISVNTVNTLKTNSYKTIRSMLGNLGGVAEYILLILFFR